MKFKRKKFEQWRADVYCTCNSFEAEIWLIKILRLFKIIIIDSSGYKELCFVYVCYGSLYFL